MKKQTELAPAFRLIQALHTDRPTYKVTADEVDQIFGVALLRNLSGKRSREIRGFELDNLGSRAIVKPNGDVLVTRVRRLSTPKEDITQTKLLTYTREKGKEVILASLTQIETDAEGKIRQEVRPQRPDGGPFGISFDPDRTVQLTISKHGWGRRSRLVEFVGAGEFTYGIAQERGFMGRRHITRVPSIF